MIRWFKILSVYIAHCFLKVLLSAYADDGGLFVPLELPTIPNDTLISWKSDSISFPDICARVVGLFTTGIELDVLQNMAQNAFKDFNPGFPSLTTHICIDHYWWYTLYVPIENINEAPLPITKLGNLILLDTSLGPTFAFKDIGQQMIVFGYVVIFLKFNLRFPPIKS